MPRDLQVPDALRRRIVRRAPVHVTVAVLACAATIVLLAVPAWQVRVAAPGLRTPVELVGAVTVVHAALVLALPTGEDVRPARNALLSGLLVLGIANATSALRLATTTTDLAAPSVATGSWIAARYLASGLFVLGGLEWPRARTSHWVVVAVGTWLAVDATFVLTGSQVWARPLVVLDGSPVGPTMALVQAVPAVLFGVGSWLAWRLHARSGASEYRWVALALEVQVAAQVHEILFPAFQGPWITSADLLRLASFLLLAGCAAAQVRRLSRDRVATIQRQQEDLAHHERLVERLRDFADREAHFRTIVTHEVATPVATIDAYTHVLARDPTRAPQALSGLATEARRLGELLSRMEELRDIDVGQLRCDLRAAAVRPLVEEASAFARTAGLGRDVVCDVEDAEVLVDPVRFGQALRNVLGNAVRIAPADTCIEVHGRLDGGWYHVGVRDHGPGFRPDERVEVVRAFTRGAAATGDEGRGVGLYLAQQVMDAHGGSLVLDAVDGPGACVVLTVAVAT